MFILNRWNVSTGEPHDTETVLCGSGRGRWSRASNGTSPTAYFIKEELLREVALACPSKIGPEGCKTDCAINFHDHSCRLGDIERQCDFDEKVVCTIELRLSLPFFFFPAPKNRLFSDVEKAFSDVEHLARLRIHGNKANVFKRCTRAVSCRFIPKFSLSSMVQPIFWSISHLQALHAVIDVILGLFPYNT